jgi:hypothetical protein
MPSEKITATAENLIQHSIEFVYKGMVIKGEILTRLRPDTATLEQPYLRVNGRNPVLIPYSLQMTAVKIISAQRMDDEYNKLCEKLFRGCLFP